VDVGHLKAIDIKSIDSLLPKFKILDITPDGRAYLDALEPEAVPKKIGF
jgi:hypothetical protein